MDDTHFVKTGKLRPNKKAIEYYLSSSGAKTLFEIAEQRVDDFIQSYQKTELIAMIEATEIALIKMVLIRKLEMKKAPPIEQYNEFMRFLKTDLGILLAREAHLAIHYFCDNAGRLLGIQANTPKDKAISIIKSTAWDMYLLRMPEIMFSESPSELCISYVSTHEKQLQALAKLFSIERIECFQNSGLTPIVNFSMVGIPEVFRKQVQGELQPINSNREKSVPNRVKPGVIQSVEKNVRLTRAINADNLLRVFCAKKILAQKTTQ